MATRGFGPRRSLLLAASGQLLPGASLQIDDLGTSLRVPSFLSAKSPSRYGAGLAPRRHLSSASGDGGDARNCLGLSLHWREWLWLRFTILQSKVRCHRPLP